MTKSPGCLPFATKAAQPFRVVSHFRRQNLNGHSIAQQDVPSQVNCSHPTLTEEGFDLILTIKDSANERRRVVFQHLTVSGAEAHIVVIFSFADGAIFHAGKVPKTLLV